MTVNLLARVVAVEHLAHSIDTNWFGQQAETLQNETVIACSLDSKKPSEWLSSLLLRAISPRARASQVKDPKNSSVYSLFRDVAAGTIGAYADSAARALFLLLAIQKVFVSRFAIGLGRDNCCVLADLSRSPPLYLEVEGAGANGEWKSDVKGLFSVMQNASQIIGFYASWKLAGSMLPRIRLVERHFFRGGLGLELHQEIGEVVQKLDRELELGDAIRKLELENNTILAPSIPASLSSSIESQEGDLATSFEKQVSEKLLRNQQRQIDTNRDICHLAKVTKALVELAYKEIQSTGFPVSVMIVFAKAVDGLKLKEETEFCCRAMLSHKQLDPSIRSWAESILTPPEKLGPKTPRNRVRPISLIDSDSEGASF